jgi:hypothetical protein
MFIKIISIVLVLFLMKSREGSERKIFDTNPVGGGSKKGK